MKYVKTCGDPIAMNGGTDLKIGYIRVSTEEQNTARQEVLLRENGLVEVGKDGHTAKSKFPKLGRFVPLNKVELEKQAKIRKRGKHDV